MQRLITFLLVLFFFVSCAEEVIQKPENLIPEDQMKLVLYDLALYNSIKSTNPSLLGKNNLDSPTEFVFKKYAIDSVTFVESDQYYASIPLKYQGMYEEIQAKLEVQQNAFKEARQRRTDSINEANEKRTDSLKKLRRPDSLPKK